MMGGWMRQVMEAVGRLCPWRGRGADEAAAHDARARRGRKASLEELAERLRVVEERLNELEAAAEARRGSDAQDGWDGSMDEEMRDGGLGEAGGPAWREECASETDAPTREGADYASTGSGPAGTPAPREIGGLEQGQSSELDCVEPPGTVPGEGEMLEKARGSAGGRMAGGAEDGTAGECDEGTANGTQADVRHGMPQGIPGQQARRKAARLWEGVL